jgi:PAS domain S-box-containing protein
MKFDRGRCRRCIQIAFVINLLWLAFNAAALEYNHSKILILHSYHQGYHWTDGVMRGILTEFTQQVQYDSLVIEYMDTKRNDSPEYVQFLKKLYRTKFRSTRFKAIIASDNAALSFILKNRAEIFPEVPVVFCGINDFHDSLLVEQSDITGILENYDFLDIVHLALKLHPETQNIAVVSDICPNCPEDMLLFRKALESLPMAYNVIEIMGGTLAEIRAGVSRLPEQTVIFRLSVDPIIYDPEYEPWENYCSLPTYTAIAHDVREGAIGGIIISPEKQGRIAAKIIRHVLAGKTIDRFPIIRKCPRQPIFNFDMLVKFKISEKMLPPGSLIINRPFSFYQTYKTMVWTTISIFSFLIGLIVLLSINIVNRHLAEKAMKENQEKYRVLIETIPHGILEISLSGEMFFANRTFLNMLKLTTENLVRQNFTNLISTNSRKKIDKYFKNNDRPSQDAPNSFKTKLRRSDGEWLDVQIDWNYKRDQEGNRPGITCVVSDITERLKAEKQEKLRQEQLLQADKLAALGTVVSGVAHEINNPNNFIILNIPLLKRTFESMLPFFSQRYEQIGDFEIAGFKFSQLRGEIPEMCDDILDGSRRIRDIVKDIKEYSQQNLADLIEAVDINQVIRSSVNLLGNYIHNHTHNLQIHYGKNLPLVTGNFQHFEQVIINLLQNSCQALPDKNKALIVTTHFISAAETVQVEIRDEGVGIPRKNLNGIFDPFFTTKRELGGVGLGLSISNTIIQKYGGKWTFTSQPGKGTTVKISLAAISPN